MDNEQKQTIITESWKHHNAIEAAYLTLEASSKDPQWPEKQRLLLADMALHLLQTALNPEALDNDKLRNNLYAILTISELYLPDADLAHAKEKLLSFESQED